MMSEKKFKVGDRVRFIGGSGPWFEHQITSGDEGVVTGKGICDDDVCVSFSIADVVDVSDLQLIESTDPRTAFLQELKELLSKHNADIWADGGWDGCCLHLELDNGREKYNVKGGNLSHNEPIELEDYFEY